MMVLALRPIRRPQLWAGAIFACLAFAYSWVTPPLRGPDERNHCLRAYQISELRFVADKLPDGFSGDYLPASLAQLSDALGDHQNNRVTDEQLAAARAIELDPAHRTAIEFSNSALYAPVVYLPAAAGIGVGRLLGASPLELLYVARTANVIATSLLIALAARLLGYACWPALLAVTLPMAVSQMALVTADALTFAFSFFWIAIVAANATTDDRPLSRKLILRLLLMALVLSQLRPPYPLLALLVFAIPLRRFARPPVAALTYAGVVLLAVAPMVIWNTSMRPLFVPEPGYDMQAQVTFLQQNPHAFLGAAAEDIVRRGAERWSQAVGRFGWLNVPLPGIVVAAYAAALALSCVLASNRVQQPRRWQRAIFLLVTIGGVVGIQLLLFLTYNLGWIQGRYFIPFIMVLAFGLAGSAMVSPRVRPYLLSLCLLIALATHVVSLLAIAQARGS